MDFLLLLMIGGFVAWLAAEPDQVSAGVRGAVTQAFTDGWRAGSRTASVRWHAGEADRAARRKRRHKRWRKTRTGRVLIVADNAGKATIGAAWRGAKIAVPAVADAVRAGARSAPQGWAERRTQRQERRDQRSDRSQGQPGGGPQAPVVIPPDKIDWPPLLADQHDPETPAEATTTEKDDQQPAAGNPRRMPGQPREEPTMTTEIPDHATLDQVLKSSSESLGELVEHIQAIVQEFDDGANPIIDAICALRESMEDSRFGSEVQGAAEETSEQAGVAAKQAAAAVEVLASLIPTLTELQETVGHAGQKVTAAVGA